MNNQFKCYEFLFLVSNIVLHLFLTSSTNGLNSKALHVVASKLSLASMDLRFSAGH